MKGAPGLLDSIVTALGVGGIVVLRDQDATTPSP